MKRKLKCVLLVDDDEPTNFLYKIIVEHSNCADHIQISQNGNDALSYLSSAITEGETSSGNPFPDLVLLDINMPRMDGWEFIDKYAQLPKNHTAQPVIIMVSTTLNPDDELRAKKIPSIAGFMHKPLTEEMLQFLLAKYFPESQ